MNLADTIRHSRFHGKMTQEALAKQVKVSRQTIINIEHGRQDPSWTLVKKLSQILAFALDSIDP